MKVTFSRQALLTSIGLSEKAVSPAGTLPILANLLIDAQGERAEIIATDLELFAKVTVEGRVEEAGRTTIPAKTLADIVRLLPDDDVAMVTSGNRLTLTCNRNVYQLSTMSPDDFPDWPKAEATTRITLRQADLKRILRHTLFAIPKNDPRKVLNGGYFSIDKQGMFFCVTTDGRKLGKSMAEPIEVVGNTKKGTVGAIIPGRVLSEIDRAIGEEGEIEVGFTDRQAIFRLPSVTYLTSLIEGSFPNYEAVIPDSFKKSIELPKAAIDDAIVRAGVLAEKRYNSIILDFQRNVIEIEAQSFEAGSYRGQVETGYEGEPFKIAFNHAFLHDVFRLVPDPTIHMKVKDSSAPVVFECESDPLSMSLVMPIRLGDLEVDRDGEDEEDES